MTLSCSEPSAGTSDILRSNSRILSSRSDRESKTVIISSRTVRPDSVSSSCGRYPNVVPLLVDTLPSSGESVPWMSRRSVVFPEPLGPTSPTLSVSPMRQERPLRSGFPPKDMLTFSIRTIPLLHRSFQRFARASATRAERGRPKSPAPGRLEHTTPAGAWPAREPKPTARWRCPMNAVEYMGSKGAVVNDPSRTEAP